MRPWPNRCCSCCPSQRSRLPITPLKKRSGKQRKPEISLIWFFGLDHSDLQQGPFYMPSALPTIILLTISNTFMTAAWYGHLKYEGVPLWKVVLVSWGIAFFEYIFQVPANRIGNVSGLSAGSLKVIQEAITLVVFVVFARWYLGE